MLTPIPKLLLPRRLSLERRASLGLTFLLRTSPGSCRGAAGVGGGAGGGGGGGDVPGEEGGGEEAAFDDAGAAGGAEAGEEPTDTSGDIDFEAGEEPEA